MIELFTAPTTGFNALAASLASEYGVDPITIDFTGSDGLPSAQFFQGDVDFDDIIKADDVVYPLMKIYTSNFHSEANQKFTLFNGPVKLTIEVLLSWPNDNASSVFCDLNDLVEEIIITLFNSPGATNAFAGGQALWNGNLAGTYSSVKPSAENWGQLVKFDAIFKVVV